jgi:hypothetical protein
VTTRGQVAPNLFGSPSEAVARITLRQARLEVALQPFNLKRIIMAKKAKKKTAKKAKKAAKKKK